MNINMDYKCDSVKMYDDDIKEGLGIFEIPSEDSSEDSPEDVKKNTPVEEYDPLDELRKLINQVPEDNIMQDDDAEPEVLTGTFKGTFNGYAVEVDIRATRDTN